MCIVWGIEMKCFLLILAFPCIALAQTPIDPRLEATVNELVKGRDTAISSLMNQTASLQAELTVLRKELEAAKKECKPEVKK